MDHARQELALVGYSNDLDKRPLKFVEPIPPSRICSACGNIPRLMYCLLCGHTLCEPCYESCTTPSECACPLDGEVSAPAEVISRKYPAENLLRRKVHCWNEANGCLVVLPSSQIAEHVRKDCQYHVTRCPNCSAAVLSRDVCAHLKSQCTALAFDAAPEPQQRANANARTHLELFEKKVEQRVRELDAKLAQLSLKSDSVSDKLSEICQSNNHLKEALTEQFGSVLGHKLAEMKVFYAEKIESLRTSVASAVAPVASDPKTHQRVITGLAELKAKAMKDGSCYRWSDRVYLRRYLISWGINFVKEGDNVVIFLAFQLHKGRDDDFLDWPFTKTLKLSIIHPETRQELHREGQAVWDGAYKKHFCRPIRSSNEPACFLGTKFDSTVLERDGYVRKDQLLLRFEVLL
ncbi:hypothetical protein HPB48_026359 [Haemaphysalis longicornis]|uniref:TRAF1-6 MATH domain-containing protein n=1 Tax=Haemaphysalis longicornis TaxID=44386 RepID=A0A9J6HBT7_HAELO|nr:hypothetical protein HPB48_026359 [Haemaphysalis longicornis]